MTVVRILHVMTRFIRGGAEEKVLLELAHLRKEHEFSIATGPETHRAVLDPLADWGIPHHVVPSLRHYAPWQAPAAIRQIGRLIRAAGYDAVHTHSAEAGLLGREAAHRQNVMRILHTIHGHEFSPAHPWPIRRAVVAFHRHLAPHTDRYLSNAEALTAEFLKAGIGRAEQYRLVPSGFDVEAARNARPVHFSDSPTVLTAARLTAGKGIEELIEAFALLRRDFPTLRLAIAGDGPSEPALRKLTKRLQVDERVEFLGFRTDLAGLLKTASVFAFPSHREGTPRAVSLALAAGCPVVASNVDGIPEQVQHGETGLLVAPKDPKALTSAVRAVLDRPEEARKRAEEGQRRIVRFGIPAMLEATRAVYREVEAVA